ncbi:MAG: cysteine-rich CWC family protein [Burkholderiales bacterium]
MNANGLGKKQCPACRVMFECGMGQDTPCWCSRGFAPVMPIPDSEADCYCSGCLSKYIAQVPTKGASRTR